jgi:hypothetical protein
VWVWVRPRGFCGGGGGAEAADDAAGAAGAAVAETADVAAGAAVASLSLSLGFCSRWVLSGGDGMCAFCWHDHLRWSTFASTESGRGSFLLGSGLG